MFRETNPNEIQTTNERRILVWSKKIIKYFVTCARKRSQKQKKKMGYGFAKSVKPNIQNVKCLTKQGEQMYYENKKKQFREDCHELNDLIGNAIDEMENQYGKKRSYAITSVIVPFVLASLLSRHFKQFYYDEPQDIINYLNYLKKIFVAECDDRDEMDMIDSIEYGSEVSA